MTQKTTRYQRPPANKGQRIPGSVNRASMLELLNMSAARFDRLVRDGAPISQSSVGIEVNVADFVEFMVKDAVKRATGGPGSEELTYDAAKRKDKAAQARMRELDLAKVEGEMVDVEDVRPIVREVFATVRSRMLAVRSQIIGLSPEKAREVDDAINDALTDLSTTNLEFGDNAAKPTAAQPLN